MNKIGRKIISALLVMAMLAGVLAMPAQKADAKRMRIVYIKKGYNEPISLTVGEKVILKFKNTKKKVSWKNGGTGKRKKNISLKKKSKTAVVITGKKRGLAKIYATIAGKRHGLRIIIKAKDKTTNKPTPTETPSPEVSGQPTEAPTGTPTPTETPGGY